MAQSIKQKTMKDVLAKYPTDKYNLLYPSESPVDVNPIFEIIEEIVRIDPNPDRQEVYEAGVFKDGDKWKQKLCLSKTSLEKLSYAAGIIFDSQETGQVQTGDPNIIQFKVQGALQKLDGSYVRATKTKTINLYEIEKEQRARLEAKALKGELYKNKKKLEWDTQECKDYIEGELKLFMIKERKDAPQKAETGAYNRVIRSLLGLKPFYTEEDLQKPFVVIKVALNVTVLMMDKQTRRAVLMSALQAQTNVFGHQIETGAVTQLLENHVEIEDDDKEDEEEELPPDIEQSETNVESETSNESEVSTAINETATVMPSPTFTTEVPIEIKEPIINKNTSQSSHSKAQVKVQDKAEEGNKGISKRSAEEEKRARIAFWMQETELKRLMEIGRLVKLKEYEPTASQLLTPEKLSIENQAKYIVFLEELPDMPAKMDWDR